MHKAHKYIEKAIKLNPKNQHFYKTTIAIYNEEGHYKKALEEIDKALSIENNNPNPIIEFNLKKIDILNVFGKDKEVKKVVEYLLLHFPTDNRVKNKNKSFKIEKPLETTDKQHLYKKIITNLQKDQYYLERTLVILDKIENPWAKNDLLGRIVEHLKFLKKNK